MKVKGPVLSNDISKLESINEITPRSEEVKNDSETSIKDKNSSRTEFFKAKENELKSITDDMNENILVFDRRIQFQTYKDTDMMYVKVVEAESGKVIREIPPEEVLKLSKNLKEMIGIIFDEKR